MEIKFKLAINAEPSTIFKAVTTRSGYQGWWTSTCDIDSEPDGESSIRFEKEEITEEMRFKTLENIPDHKFIWLCVANNVFPSWVSTTLIFDIKKNKEGCTLTFTQKSNDEEWDDHPDYLPSQAGWDFFMESLIAYCETGYGNPWES